jgi:hypothetical protein
MTDHDRAPRKIPAPAKQERREPLPGRNPKPPADDPAARARLDAIMASPSYRIAAEDEHFLDSNAARGARLQLDYLKAEGGLREAGIERCIVVFGSTRLCEPAAARRRVEAARRPSGRPTTGAPPRPGCAPRKTCWRSAAITMSPGNSAGWPRSPICQRMAVLAAARERSGS